MINQALKSQHLFEERKKYVPNAQSIFHPSTGMTAKNAIVTDANGRELIDFSGGIGVVNSGHNPDPVVKAIQEQASRMIHACFAVTVHQPYLDLCTELADLFPHGNSGTKVVLTNCGAEAVENAVKFARQATQRSAVICYDAAFHGRTYMALSLTSKTAAKKGCGSLIPDIYRLEFPFYGKRAQAIFESEQAFADYHIDRLHRMFSYQVHEENVAAIVLEAIQGEGGFNPISYLYLKKLRSICDEKGIMLIIDEIQSGFGRTNQWASYKHYDVIPNISTWGKSMGGGMPIGCVIGDAAIMDRALAGTVGGTYLGNPVCSAASLANIRYMREININLLAEKVAAIVKLKFEKLQADYPKNIFEVKGLGAMLAMEFINKEGKPDKEIVQQVIELCWRKGLIIITAGPYSNHIRCLSPLTIPEEQLIKGLNILEDALRTILD